MISSLVESLFSCHAKKKEKRFPINSRVKIDREKIVGYEALKTHPLYSELAKTDLFIYLGDVYGVDGVGLMVSTKTGAVVDAHKDIFYLA